MKLVKIFRRKRRNRGLTPTEQKNLRRHRLFRWKWVLASPPKEKKRLKK